MTVKYLETGVLYCEDNLAQLASFPDECVDLIYLDPPFFSNRSYEVIWGDEAEVRSFEDRWDGGIEHYVGWMRQRVREMYRVLKPTGSLYLHCDWHAGHRLRVMLDEVFGPERFVNEIVWKRSSAHSDGKQGAKHYGRVTDNILFYSKSDQRTFNLAYQKYEQEYIDRDYRRVDPDGRRYRISDMSGPGGAAKGNPFYEVLGVSRHWRYTKEKMDELVAAGRVVQTRPGAVPQYKRYLDEMPGVPAQNLWADLPVLNNRSRERLGYPTQKPESLLERIISVSSNPGDVVLDPFCGCGTTVAVAERLGREWVGIDISPTAVNLMKLRLQRQTKGRTNAKVVGYPVTELELHDLKPFEFQNWVIQQYFGTHSPRKSGDMGIDGYSFFTNDPIQVKQSEKVGRNVIDNFETAMARGGHTKGYIVGFSFTKGAKEEVARALWESKLEIKLVTVKQLLESKPEERIDLHRAPAEVRRLLPMPNGRDRDARPSVEELLRSDQRRSAG